MTHNAMLLVIDVQRGFMSAHTEDLVPRLEQLLREARGIPVAFTQYKNYQGSPYFRFLKWELLTTEEECSIVPSLQKYARKTFIKNGYSALTPEFSSYLKEHNIDTVYLAGVDTDCCVMTTAIQLFEAGIRPIVLANYCASNGGLEFHNSALKVLERLIGRQHIVLGPHTWESLVSLNWAA